MEKITPSYFYVPEADDLCFDVYMQLLVNIGNMLADGKFFQRGFLFNMLPVFAGFNAINLHIAYFVFVSNFF